MAAAALRDPTALGRTRTAATDLGVGDLWDDVVCVVHDADGRWGAGMTQHAGPVVPLINDMLAPVLEGTDVTPAVAYDRLSHRCREHFGSMGIASYAISAVDLALWDLAGKIEQQPCHRMWGGPESPELICYATGADVRELLDEGFEAIKLPCPWTGDAASSLDQILVALDEARNLIGSGDLMLDCWSIDAAADAIEVGRAVSAHDLAWIEDYVRPDDWVAYAEVRAALPDAVLASGERWHTELPFTREIATGSVDIVQPDALWVGGATPTLRIAETAARHGVGTAIHCAGNDSYGQHHAAALRDHTVTEVYRGVPRYRATPGMGEPVAGIIVPSEEPGFGLALDLETIERAT